MSYVLVDHLRVLFGKEGYYDISNIPKPEKLSNLQYKSPQNACSIF